MGAVAVIWTAILVAYTRVSAMGHDKWLAEYTGRTWTCLPVAETVLASHTFV